MARFDLEGGVVEGRDVLVCLRSATIFEDKIQGVHKIFVFLDDSPKGKLAKNEPKMSISPFLAIVGDKKWSSFLDLSARSPIFCT